MAAKEAEENVVFLPLEIVKNSVGFSFDIGETCCWLVRGSLFIELGAQEEIWGKGGGGDLGTFMIRRPI